MIKTRVMDEKNVISTGKVFDYSEQADFRKAYESFSDSRPVEVDMSETDFVDSAALGMLLILRDHFGGDKSRVKIVNAKDNVISILTVSNFQKIFTIE